MIKYGGNTTRGKFRSGRARSYGRGRGDRDIGDQEYQGGYRNNNDNCDRNRDNRDKRDRNRYDSRHRSYDEERNYDRYTGKKL